MSNYEFNRHKKSDKIKWVFTGIAFVLVFVMLIGMCLQLFGKGKVKPSEWFNKTECVHIDENGDGKCDKCKNDMPADGEDDKPQVDNGTGGMDIADGSVTESGIKLNRRVISRASYEEEGISPLAESAYTLTVSVEPLGATDVFVWTVTGNDDEGITLTASEMSATVVCNKAFGTQKVITVTSKTNSSITASCTVDYYKRLQGVTLNAPTTLKLNTTATDYSVSLSPTYSVGTILDTTVKINSISVVCIGQVYNNTTVYYSGMTANAKETVTGNVATGKFSLVMSPSVKSSFFNKLSGADIPAFYAAYFKEFVSNCGFYTNGNQYEISVGWYASRAGGTFDSGTLKVQGRFDVSGIKVAATNVALSESNLLF